MLNESDDTLTESCEGAVNFMVMERTVGSLQKSSPWCYVEDGECGIVKPRICFCATRGVFVFLSEKTGRSAEKVAHLTEISVDI